MTLAFMDIILAGMRIVTWYILLATALALAHGGLEIRVKISRNGGWAVMLEEWELSEKLKMVDSE
jgi:hypothetical protein